MLHRNVFLLLLLVVAATLRSRADDGYRLWLKYDRIADAAPRQQYQRAAQFIASPGATPVLRAATGELHRGLSGLLGQAVPVVATAGSRTGGIVLRVDAKASANGQPLKPEGYHIFSESKTW
jgi:alpha-glucuronidase